MFNRALKRALQGWRRKPVSTLFKILFFFFFSRCSKAEGIRITEAVGSCGGNQGGLPLVPDVLARQHGREGPCDRGSVWEPPSNEARCEMSNHICFYSKQSGANTAGSAGLLLKVFWGLLRDSPDGVIYPLFAERTRMECDAYGHGIPISQTPPGTPKGLMNLRGALQQDEISTLLGCRSSSHSSFGQRFNSRYFLFYLTELLNLSHVICPIQQTWIKSTLFLLFIF